MKKYFILSCLIAVSTIVLYGCGEKEFNDPEVPGGGTELPTDPEEPDPDPEAPDEPINPSDIFFENFSQKEVPNTFKMYDVDDAVINPTPDTKHAWLAANGNGIYSYGQLKDEVQVDDWIVTPAIKINLPNSVLSWRMTALPSAPLPPGAPVPTNKETYEVYISTEGQDLSCFQGKTPQYTTKVLVCGTFELPEIKLDAYLGKEIYLAFRHCTPSGDADVLWLQNIKVREYPDVDLSCGAISFLKEPSRTFKAEKKLTVQAIINNRSLKEVTAFKARYKYGDQEVEQIFNQSIGRESRTTIEFSTQIEVVNPGESQNITVEVIYDGDQNTPNNTNSTQLVCIGTEPHKRVLLEKITSFGCQACGAGHEMVENTENANPEKVVGVSVHVDGVIGKDNTDCESFVNAYVAWRGLGIIQDDRGLPLWGTNRRFRGMNIDASFNNTTAPASIDVDVVYNTNDNSFDAIVKTIFAANAVTEGYYALGLGVLEDGIDNWQSGTTKRIHNNTARELIGGNKGESNSLPKNVVKGVENSYTFHHQIPAKYGIDTRVPDPAKMEVVAILYDAMTGEALNCVKAKIIK